MKAKLAMLVLLILMLAMTITKAVLLSRGRLGIPLRIVNRPCQYLLMAV